MKQLAEKLFSRATYLILYGAYIPNQYFIFNSQKVVYIPIPKVACTSIKIALMSSEAGHANSHDEYMNIHTSTAHYMVHSIASYQRDYFKFAFVRNPFDRLVSCYKDKVKRKIQHNGRYHFDTHYNNTLIRHLFGDAFRHDMSFREFAELVAKVPDFLADGHFKSQYSVLCRRGAKLPDFIGKFEHLEEDWQVMADQHGFPQLSIRNRTEQDDWRSYYTSREIIETVAKRYSKDIDSFGYTSEYKELLNSIVYCQH